MPYRSSNSRITKQQTKYNLPTDEIISFVKDVTEAEEAEKIWFLMREQGSKMSHTTFNNRLKILVEEGLVE
jgi:Fe2+ or Zn2+ uptake regulation protein